jgi:hypothetical protein
VVTERAGELAAEAGVFLGELLVALEGSGEAGAQRGVGCPLAGRDRGGRARIAGAAELPDLVADVGLGIEPGSGDARCAGDGGEGNG